MNLDRAINQRFLLTGRTSVNKRKQSSGLSEVVSVMKGYMHMPREDQGQFGSLDSV